MRIMIHENRSEVTTASLACVPESTNYSRHLSCTLATNPDNCTLKQAVQPSTAPKEGMLSQAELYFSSGVVCAWTARVVPTL